MKILFEAFSSFGGPPGAISFPMKRREEIMTEFASIDNDEILEMNVWLDIRDLLKRISETK